MNMNEASSQRVYDLSKSANDAILDISIIASQWVSNQVKNEEEQKKLIEWLDSKVFEEVEEFKIGPEAPVEINESDETVSIVGDSKVSEAITGILTFHHAVRARMLQDFLKTNPATEQILSISAGRYLEQWNRYHQGETLVLNQFVNSAGQKIVRDQTFWLVKRSRDGRMLGCKVKFDGYVPYISEVADLDPGFHLSNGLMVLPISYEPYHKVQNAYLLDGETRGVSIDSNYVLDFFNPRGVEMIDKAREGNYIEWNEVNWHRPLLGSFEEMRYV